MQGPALLALHGSWATQVVLFWSCSWVEARSKGHKPNLQNNVALLLHRGAIDCIKAPKHAPCGRGIAAKCICAWIVGRGAIRASGAEPQAKNVPESQADQNHEAVEASQRVPGQDRLSIIIVGEVLKKTGLVVIRSGKRGTTLQIKSLAPLPQPTLPGRAARNPHPEVGGAADRRPCCCPEEAQDRSVEHGPGGASMSCLARMVKTCRSTPCHRAPCSCGSGASWSSAPHVCRQHFVSLLLCYSALSTQQERDWAHSAAWPSRRSRA